MFIGKAKQAYNILWICTDSQRFDTLGCYGNCFVRTPNIDRLAGSGVVFENAFCQSPLCMPSRGSFLTGRYPITNRLRQNGQMVPPDLRPVTRTLADAGYLCGLSGKLHLSACDQRVSLGKEWWKEPKEQWIRYAEDRVDDGYASLQWDHAPQHFSPASGYARFLMQKTGELPRPTPSPLSSHIQKGLAEELHQTTWCVEEAIAFLRTHKVSECPMPWLFSVNIFDPHPAYDPPEEYLKPYLERLDELPLPSWVEGELDTKPEFQRKAYESADKHSTRTMTPRDLRLVKAAYYAMVDLIDKQVGRLLAALEETGQLGNTLVIFTSDHGELVGDHGRTFKGPYLYDGQIHVPLIFSLPGVIPGGRRISGLVEMADLAPTVLEAAGLERDGSMQAKSLWPMLMSGSSEHAGREDVYCEYLNANPGNPPIYMTMVRTRTHKLVAVHSTGEGELYDLREDPEENRNLWGSPAHAGVKMEMLQRLCARLAYTADPNPPRIGVF